MRIDFIESHLQRAAEVQSSFEKFDALWAAFNVMYEAKRTELIALNRHRNPSERETAKYCASLLHYNSWIHLFPSTEMSNLFRIAPILNVRDLLRRGQMNTNEFDELLRLNLEENSGNLQIDINKLYALIDLLYIVRCNKAHGFKTIERVRDIEVLDLTTPLLEIIVTRLYDLFR